MKKNQPKTDLLQNSIRNFLKPSQPACFVNSAFKDCINDVFSIFFKVLPPNRIFVSGGCLSRTYIDHEMHPGHQKSFGDIDFKLPNCSQDELFMLLNHFNVSPYSTLYNNALPLITAFNCLLSAGGILETCYFKNNRVVIRINWRHLPVDFVLFSESLDQHARTLDLSVNAGFYNPMFQFIYFPIDDDLEQNELGENVPCNRSVNDFHNRQLNLIFPKQYERIFDEDPIRILHVVKALSRSNFVLSPQLRNDIASYIHLKKTTVFLSVNPDRLYYNIKQLFFSGHAVKNLNVLLELNLLEALFLNLTTVSEQSKQTILRLVRCVAEDSDRTIVLPPSILFYAIFWDRIKDIIYSPNIIFECSNRMIRLPLHTSGLNSNEVLTHDLHNNNINYLTRCEERFLNAANLLQPIEASLKVDSAFVEPIESAVNEVLTPVSVSEPINELAVHPETDRVLKKKKLKPEKPQPIEKTSDATYAKHCQKGMELFNQKKYKDAKKELEKAIEINKTSSDAYRLLGACFKKQADDLTPAVESASVRLNFLKSEPVKNKKLLIESKEKLSEILQNQQDKLKKAKEYYEQAVSVDTNDSQSVEQIEKINQLIQQPCDVLIQEPSPAPIIQNKKNTEVKNNRTQKKTKKASSSVNTHAKDINVTTLTKIDNPFISELAKAKEEEHSKRYNQAINLYNQLFLKHKLIESGYKCIELCDKVGQYDKAYRYATTLVDIPESDYIQWHPIEGDNLFNNYQYHHYFSLYQRGKIGLKLNKRTQAVADFDCIINLCRQFENALDKSLFNILVQVYIQLGDYYFTSLNQWNLSTAEQNYSYATKNYIKALDLVNQRGDPYRHQLNEIYIKLGDVERKKGHFDGDYGAKYYYKKSLDVIDEFINNDFYPYDKIGDILYQYAYNIGGYLAEQRITDIVSGVFFLLTEQDFYFLKWIEEICISSIIYTRNVFQKAHLLLIKTDILFGRYNNAIVKIDHMMAGDFKQTNACQRELFLLLGFCCESTREYEKAIFFYEKAQLLRYDDDNDLRDTLMNLAEKACKRAHKNKKNVLLFYPNSVVAEPVTEAPIKIQVSDEKKRAFSVVYQGQFFQKHGNFEQANKYYRDYLSSCCNIIKILDPVADSEKIYNLFYQFAIIVINNDVMEKAVRQILFEKQEPGCIVDLAYLPLIKDIYTEALKYSTHAYSDLIIVNIIGKDYAAAIKLILFVLEQRLENGTECLRQLYIVLAMLYEETGDDCQAEIFYQKSSRKEPYLDDNSHTEEIIQLAQSFLQQKINSNHVVANVDNRLKLSDTNSTFFKAQSSDSRSQDCLQTPGLADDANPCLASQDVENSKNISIFS